MIKKEIKKTLYQKIILPMAAVTTAACLLCACGPEPGEDDAGAGGPLFGQEEPAGPADSGDAAAGSSEKVSADAAAAEQSGRNEEDHSGQNTETESGQSSEAVSGKGSGQASQKDSDQNSGEDSGQGDSNQDTGQTSGQGDSQDAGSQTEGFAGDVAAGLDEEAFSGDDSEDPKKAGSSNDQHPSITGTPEAMDNAALQEIQSYLNEDSSYGFLLSSYEAPEDIDLNEVFYSGAGFPQGKLEKKEEELLLERIPQKELHTPVVKVTQEQIDELLKEKAGIDYAASNFPLEENKAWARIGRYNAWYAPRGDTNRRYIECTDGWQQGNTLIVHYRLLTDRPQSLETAGKTEALRKPEAADAAATTASGTASTSAGEKEAADESKTITDTGSSAKPEAADTASTPAGEKEAEAVTEAVDTASTPVRETAETAKAELTRSEDAGSDTGSAVYQPVYEVQLVKKGNSWQFCSNILWVQKDLIEAQSYHADLNPVGEVFFAPFYPDTEADLKADVTFALVQGKELRTLLAPVEKGNIRADRVFNEVDAVDFTDYNGDGFTDILTVCSYTLLDEDGRRGKVIREARVYTGQKDGVPFFDEKKTEKVNSSVQTLNITNVTKYLTGKSDGKDKKFSSWKEAFADHIRGLDLSEYKGFSLIHINDGRTPELVQTGATTAKGATVVVYRNGTLEETWLNRNTFQYLEYENVLYSPSGVENLHYDSIYSIVAGRLDISVQGYYGNSRFACIQYDSAGKPVYDYYWDGGEVSANGYRDGISFVFDSSRAKECGTEGLMTAEEILKKLE